MANPEKSSQPVFRDYESLPAVMAGTLDWSSLLSIDLSTDQSVSYTDNVISFIWGVNQSDRVRMSKDLKKINLVAVSQSNLGIDKTASLLTIFDKAKEHYLDICPIETAFLLAINLVRLERIGENNDLVVMSEGIQMGNGEVAFLRLKSVLDGKKDKLEISVWESGIEPLGENTRLVFVK